MAKCTAPIYGHRTESERLNCPVCGKLGGRISYNLPKGYTPYASYYSPSSSSTTDTSRLSNGVKKKAKWSPAGSTVLYTPAEIRTLAPIRENIVKQPNAPEKYDLFLCHAWDDRKGAAKELCDKLTKKGRDTFYYLNYVRVEQYINQAFDALREKIDIINALYGE